MKHQSLPADRLGEIRRCRSAGRGLIALVSISVRFQAFMTQASLTETDSDGVTPLSLIGRREEKCSADALWQVRC